MEGELKERVTRGVAWSMAEKIGSMLLQAGVSIVVLRMLMPDDFGLVALLTAFAAVALVVVDSGFSQTLIRKQQPVEEEYKSVFLFNVVVAVVLYFLLVGLSPLVARYYAMPELVSVAPVFFLILPVNALCVIQNTIFTRQFRFDLLSKVTFLASVVSGASVVVMALCGCGVWSLVAQRLLQMLTRAVALWWLSPWRPTGRWSAEKLRRMAPYSFSLMTTDLISALYNKVPHFFIGKLYSADTLGYYDQAQKLKDLPVLSAMTSVQGVTFPALSKIAGDERKFAESFRQLLMVVSYLMFPAMLGMSAVGREVFVLLLGEKWLPTVPYFETLCLTGLFYPIAMLAYNVMKVKCRGGVIVRLEVLKKVILSLILLVCIPRSVQAVVWGWVVFSACEMVVNLTAALRHSELTLRRLLETLLPLLLTAGVMYGVVQVLGHCFATVTWTGFLLQILAGAGVYLFLSVLFRLEAFEELLRLLKHQFAKLFSR